jgi:O-antigen ligase
VAIYGVLPVGTLSPHHKQIGVVMLMGMSMTLSLIREEKNFIPKVGYLVLLGTMIAVTVFSISRSAWLGMGGLIAAYFIIHRSRAVWVMVLVTIGFVIFTQLNVGSLKNTLQTRIEEVTIDRYERFGFEGISGDRLSVYDNYPKAIMQAPWILLIGTGFQNVVVFLRAAGAHNNYAQAWFELGIFGFIIYMRLLFSILANLKETGKSSNYQFGGTVAKDIWAVFIAIMATMLVGETFWAQASMYTLTGQIMTLVGLAISPLFWLSDSGQTPQKGKD